MNDWTTRTAEYVLPGHPDKLADAIADAVVAAARKRERRALVGVEVALHRDVVFIDGRVACEGAEELDIEGIARGVYEAAGYNSEFPPATDDLKVISDLCLGPLLEGEAEFREIADDQSIVTGYACSLPGTNYLPVEHALAGRLSRELDHLRVVSPELRLGPDGKLILFVQESSSGRQFVLESVSVSIQHAVDWDPVQARRAIDQLVRRSIDQFAVKVPGFNASSDFELKINNAGDFVEGGPFGDNGLSGKKLVVDFYGPRVPIGGGAMFGKDLFKVDRAGPIIARKIAVAAMERCGLRECFLTLGIRPGDRSFTMACATDGRGKSVDIAAAKRLVRLELASVDGSVPADCDAAALPCPGSIPKLEEQLIVWDETPSEAESADESVEPLQINPEVAASGGAVTRKKAKKARTTRQLVYGVLHDSTDSLVFLPKRKAGELSHLWTVLETAKTWGELRATLPRKRVREIREYYMGGEAERTDVLESAPFDSGEIGALVNGDWPDWPQQMMLKFMPTEIIEEFGKVEDSVHNGLFLTLDPAKTKEIIARLKRSGFRPKEDTAKIRKACGCC